MEDHRKILYGLDKVSLELIRTTIKHACEFTEILINEASENIELMKKQIDVYNALIDLVDSEKLERGVLFYENSQPLPGAGGRAECEEIPTVFEEDLPDGNKRVNIRADLAFRIESNSLEIEELVDKTVSEISATDNNGLKYYKVFELSTKLRDILDIMFEEALILSKVFISQKLQ